MHSAYLNVLCLLRPTGLYKIRYLMYVRPLNKQSLSSSDQKYKRTWEMAAYFPAVSNSCAIET